MNIHTCTPRQLKSLLRHIFTAGLVAFVQSSPGIGKSSITKELADEFSLEFIDHRLSTSEPTDLN